MRRAVLIALFAVACRPRGLPEEPSGADASDPAAPAPAAPKRQAIDRSAFEDVPLSEGGHAHHHGKGGSR